ncbi:hypothetical protein, partial [Streptomyces virginiae]
LRRLRPVPADVRGQRRGDEVWTTDRVRRESYGMTATWQVSTDAEDRENVARVNRLERSQ